MRTKRFLSILLSLVLVLGMFPGMSLTASATGSTTEITPTNTSGAMTITLVVHGHSFTYAAGTGDKANTITATCTATDCPLTNNTATLTIAAPTMTTYGQSGESISADATITDPNKIRGTATVSYYKATKKADGTYEKKTGEVALTSAPTDAGDYVAEITLGTEANNTATAHVGYTIAKAGAASLDANAAKSQLTINYGTEQVTAIGSGYEVSTDGQTAATTAPVSLTSILDSNGTPTVYVRRAETANTNAGTWVAVTLAARPAAPSSLGSTNATNGTSTDGTITGVDDTMEYSTDGTNWTVVSGTTITGLNPGNYQVRKKATSNAPHGVAASVTVGSNFVALDENTKPEVYKNNIAPDPDTNYKSGDVLKAVTTANPVTYQWQTRTSEGEWTDVQGATSVTYTVTDADCNKKIRVVVTQSVNDQGQTLTDENVIKKESSATSKVLSAASIGDKYYPTIEAALNAANPGDTVKLEYHIENQVTVASGKDIVLDLNSRTIESTITNNGKLAIKDSSDEKTGTVKGNVTSSGELIIEDGKFDGTVSKQEENSKVTIKGGYFKQEWDAIKDMVDSGSQQDTSYKDDNGTYKTHVVKKPAPPAPSTPSTPAVETITIPVSGDAETVNVTVQVKDNTATVTGADVDKVLEAKNVGTVTVDVSSLKEEVKEVVLPAALVEKVATAVADKTNDADSMEVKLTAGTVTFDEKAVAAIKEQSKGKDLHLNLDAIKENKLNTAQQTTVKELNTLVVLDAYVTADGKRISNFNGGTATFSVPVELKDGQVPEGVAAFFVDDNGDMTEIPCSCDGNTATGTVEHFSNYVVTYDESRVTKPEPQPEPEPEPTPGPATPTDIGYDDLSEAEKKQAEEIASALGVDKDTAAAMVKAAAELGVSLDTVKLSGAALAKMNVDSSDPAGTDFGKLTARVTKRTNSALTLKWTKQKNADGYLIYGNKCGKGNKMKLLKTIKKNGTVSYTQKKLKKGTYYKYMVVAYKNVNGQKMPIAASVVLHAPTKGGKTTVAKSLTVKQGKKAVSKLTVKKGKSVTVKVTENKEEKKLKIKSHRKVKFESSDKKIATVNNSGKITGKKKGKATVWAYAQNGIFKAVKVTVK